MRYATPEMFRLPTALLPLLTGCHVFASGDILLTCDDLADCGTVDSVDTGTPFVPLSVGIALSISEEDRWLTGVLAPPELTPDFQRGGDGSIAGAVQWAPDRSRLFLASSELLLILGSEKDDVSKVEIPTTEDVLDMALTEDGLYILTHSWLINQAAPSAPLTNINDAKSDLDFSVLATDGTDLYIVTDSDAEPDLFVLEASTGFFSALAENFDANTARVAGDIFIGPDGALMGCSAAGAIVSVDELIAGNTPEVQALVSTTIDDVLACGYDPDIDRYLVISAAQGLFITAIGEDDIQLPLTSDGQTLVGASIY